MMCNNSQGRTYFWFINLLLNAFLISGCFETEKTNTPAECMGSECDTSDDGDNEECTGEDCDADEDVVEECTGDDCETDDHNNNHAAEK